MYIFEGRGKGATWSLLLEALHNQGVVIVESTGFADYIRNDIVGCMENKSLISPVGADYLMNAVFSLDEWDKEGKHEFKNSPVYLDNGLVLIQNLLRERLGTNKIDIIALGNDDNQIVDPFQIKERKNTFVTEQSYEDSRFRLSERWKNL